MSITDNIKEVLNTIPETVKLIAVSKFHSNEDILEAYNAGQRVFGESKAQELKTKQEELPKDIEWHFIGHLQTNKIKYISSYISLIHSVDSFKLLSNIDKEAKKVNRVIPCLLQLHVAEEDTKFGFTFDEVYKLIEAGQYKELVNIKLVGIMGMASNTDDLIQVQREFKELHNSFLKLKKDFFSGDECFKEISMGMSHDYSIAIQEGSTMVRVGSKIFGDRVY